MKIFNDAFIEERKRRAAAALDTVMSPGDIVLVQSGEPIQKPGGHDQTYPFLPHPDYMWLTGTRRPFGISAYSKDEGWIDFVKPVSRDEKIWEGGAEVIPGTPVEELNSWLTKKAAARVFCLGKKGIIDWSKNIVYEDTHIIQEAFNEVRRIKDKAEIQLILKLASIANLGYSKIKNYIKPGVSERQIQLEYEFAVLSGGSEKMPYESIVGTGTNAAILHAIPTSRLVKSGEMVLIDAGADINDYCVDITRMFAADGKFTTQQQQIYSLVLKAQQSSMDLCRPGTPWVDVHRASARVFAHGLKDIGIITGEPEEAMESGAIAVFFPHGVGHMVGLRVRDVGGRFVKDPKSTCGAHVRVDLPLQENFIMTIEPGLYFIDALINDQTTRNKFSSQINWSEVDKWKGFGGIRIEDDILVTSNGYRNLTEIVPK